MFCEPLTPLELGDRVGQRWINFGEIPDLTVCVTVYPLTVGDFAVWAVNKRWWFSWEDQAELGFGIWSGLVSIGRLCAEIDFKTEFWVFWCVCLRYCTLVGDQSVFLAKCISFQTSYRSKTKPQIHFEKVVMKKIYFCTQTTYRYESWPNTEPQLRLVFPGKSPPFV